MLHIPPIDGGSKIVFKSVAKIAAHSGVSEYQTSCQIPELTVDCVELLNCTDTAFCGSAAAAGSHVSKDSIFAGEKKYFLKREKDSTNVFSVSSM